MQHFYRFGFLLLCLAWPAFAQAQVYGCTDPNANNYSAAANQNDGSCTYATTTLLPTALGTLSDTIRETSGLIFWNGNLWTHNDDTDTTLYAIDTTDGHIVKRIAISGADNHDWEEITQDDQYIYLGDFGNNNNGNRTNLAILRIAKEPITAGATVVTPDFIYYSYADQSNFSGTGNNNTDFDCEAFIVAGDSLYLFNKQHVSGKSKIYVLPKIPGIYSAIPKSEFNVDGLITGATYIAAKKTVVLCGYKKQSALYQPFIYLLYDYAGTDFFSGNKRMLLVNPLLYQTEGIATIDGKRFFISNEKKVVSSAITIDPQLRSVDLSPYLNHYYSSLSAPAMKARAEQARFYPNPATSNFTTTLNANRAGQLQVNMYNPLGQEVRATAYGLHTGINEIVLPRDLLLSSGVYWIKLTWEEKMAWGKVILK